MIEYRCPVDGRLLLEAAGFVDVVLRTKCPKCKGIVTPIAKGPVLQRTYRCSTCGRNEHQEVPKRGKTHCIPCGTATLVVTHEVRVEPAKREPVLINR